MTYLRGEAAVEKAREIAYRVHGDVLDKVGNPYIEHPARVVAYLKVPSWQARVVAWLHDAVEDGDLTLEQVHTLFGPMIAAAVDAISHRPHEPRTAYYARVRANRLALAVKEADLRDNNDPARRALLDEQTASRLEKKYAKAYDELGLSRHDYGTTEVEQP